MRHVSRLRMNITRMICGRVYSNTFVIVTVLVFVGVLFYVRFLTPDLDDTPVQVERFHGNSNNNNMHNKRLENGSCIPKENIVFLKTHKCASSTVQNILFRYGDTHELNFVLPISGHYLGAIMPFHRKMISGTPWHAYGYNIFTQHTIFNENEIRAVMPNQSIFISILRDPVSLYESLYTYSRFDVAYKMDIEEFARSQKPFGGNRSTRVSGHLGRNQMLYDLGFDGNYFEDGDKIDEYIKKLDDTFHLMLIAERFDESLILLQHLLCWDLDDIVYFKHNARADKHRQVLSDEARKLLRDYNAADQVLYNYFVAKLEAKIEDFGKERMKMETEKLHRRNAQWYEMCVAKAVEANTLRDGGRTWNNQVIGFHIPYTVRNNTCFNLAKAEIPYTSRLRLKQVRRTIQITRTLYGMPSYKRPEIFGIPVLQPVAKN